MTLGGRYEISPPAISAPGSLRCRAPGSRPASLSHNPIRRDRCASSSALRPAAILTSLRASSVNGCRTSSSQPVIVENRPGASSNLATEAVIRAPADGYTLLLSGAVNAVNATLYEKLSFNFISDVAAVAGVSRFPNVMTVGASFPATTVPEFIAYAKSNPGKISQGVVRQRDHATSRRRTVQNDDRCQLHPCPLSRRVASTYRSAQRTGAGLCSNPCPRPCNTSNRAPFAPWQ